jgi:hypothetical protein
MPVSFHLSRSAFVSLLTVLLLVVACSSVKAPPVATPSEAASPDAPVESSELLDVSEFNATNDEAVDSGETWPQDPIEAADKFIWGRMSAYYTWLEKQDNRVEAADSTVITLIRDGNADDSVRGDWHRIKLNRLPDGTWRLIEARRAFRCYRGHQQDTYGERLCL